MNAARFLAPLDRLADARVFAAVVIGYYALAWIVRMGLLSGASGDEAQLMLYSQHLALGYDIVNPPVAGWLGWAVERAVGPSLGGALLVRYGLLAGFFILFHGAARALIPDRRLALAAALAPVGFWFLGWEALRVYMDSLVLIAALAAVLWLIAALERRPESRMWLALLAIAVALGLLGKYNFLPAFLLLSLAALASPRFRPVVRSAGYWLAAGIGLVLAAPAYGWALLNRGIWLDAAEHRLIDSAWASEKTTSFLERLLVAPDAAGGFVLPLLPLMLLCFARELWGRRSIPGQATDTARWLWLYLGLFLVLASLLAAALGMERMREHYMFVLIPLPLALAASLPATGARPGSVLAFVGINLLLAIVALGALAAQAISQPYDCTKCRMVMPWPDYASTIRELGFERGTIVSFDSPSTDAGANLRRHLPEARVWSSKRPHVRPPARPSAQPGDCLVVWNDSRYPDTLDRLRRDPVPLLDTPLPDSAEIARVDATLPLLGRPAPTLGVALIRGGLGACR